jgi:pimeloyl-ACP methyl ester carboxylesterase
LYFCNSVARHRTLDLLSAHHKLYIADWVGFGRSSSLRYEGECCKDAEDYWLQPFDSWTEQLGLKQFALAGHSLGGYLCCKYAAARPHRVNMLVLVSPGGTTVDFATVYHAQQHATADKHQSAAVDAASHDDHEEHAAADATYSVGHGGDSDDDHSSQLQQPPHNAAASPPASLLTHPRVRDFVWSLSPSGVLRKLGPYEQPVLL